MKDAVHDEYRDLGDHWWLRARRAIFGRLLDAHVPLPDDAHILDIGPASGANLDALLPRGRVTALDEDQLSLAACLRHGAWSSVRADATTPPLGPGEWDLVCALDVLEHLSDDRTALAAWRGLLKPNGRLLLTVPAMPLLWGRQDVLSGHHRRYRRAQLGALLREAGFRVDRLTYFNSILFPPILAVRVCMRPLLGWSVRRNRSDLSMPAFGLNGLLYRLFAAEGPWLVKRDLPFGVSLLCLASPDRSGETAS